jgi:adenylylsulfate kinase
MSGAGKSTLAAAVGAHLESVRAVEILDGDVVRAHLSSGLGFTREDRDTNVRRIGFVARLLARHGVFVIAAAISPYAGTRDEIRELAQAEGIAFIEVFVNPTLDSLIARDVKGLYRRALAGEIPHFTGVSDPYEPPLHPELEIATDVESVETSTGRILALLRQRGLSR